MCCEELAASEYRNVHDTLNRHDQLDWLIRYGREILANQSTERTKTQATLLSWQRALLEEQSRLRWRSRLRFPNPSLWLWTDQSLSQASDYWSATYKATLFPVGERVIDACCGAGSDLIALAARGDVLGIDFDRSIAMLARNNACAHGHAAEVNAQQLPEAWQSFRGEWLNIDPDRRTYGNKTTDAEQFSPTLEEALEMAQQSRGAIIKLAPSTRIGDDLNARIETQTQRVWLGNRGECRQQLLLCGLLHLGNSRQAVLCEPAGPEEPTTQLAIHQFSGQPVPSGQAAQRCSAFVYDLHSTLHAAELQAAWATTQSLRCLADDHGYFTGDELIQTPWAQAFEVKEVMAWDDRQVRKWLRAFGAGQVEVKCRSVKINANEFQKRYSRDGQKKVTLLVTRLNGRVRAIAAQRIDGRDSAGSGAKTPTGNPTQDS